YCYRHHPVLHSFPTRRSSDLAYGFVARVLTGPTLSPLGQLVTRVVTPWLGLPPKYVSGPPKRFAQGIGVAFSTTAAILALGFGRSEEHTSELQSLAYLVCRLL